MWKYLALGFCFIKYSSVPNWCHIDIYVRNTNAIVVTKYDFCSFLTANNLFFYFA